MKGKAIDAKTKVLIKSQGSKRKGESVTHGRMSEGFSEEVAFEL